VPAWRLLVAEFTQWARRNISHYFRIDKGQHELPFPTRFSIILKFKESNFSPDYQAHQPNTTSRWHSTNVPSLFQILTYCINLIFVINLLIIILFPLDIEQEGMQKSKKKVALSYGSAFIFFPLHSYHHQHTR
jgi:hypothetical protein